MKELKRGGRLAALLSALFLFHCADPPGPVVWTPEDFPNVLDLRGLPDDSRDLTAFAFSDLGGWHMFGLPDPAEPSRPGSFPGPLLLTDRGVWLSPSFVGPEVRIGGEVVTPVWDPAASSPATYFPGLLRQELVAGPLKVRVDLVFSSPYSSHIRAEIQNGGEVPVEVGPGWEGGPLFLDAAIREEEGGVTVDLAASGTRILVHPLGGVEEILIDEGAGAGYRIREASFILAPGAWVTRYLRISVLPADLTRSGPEEGYGGDSDPEGAFRDAEERWTGYLGAVLGERQGGNFLPSTQERVAVKAIETLVSNWRSHREDLRHDGLFPSYAYRGFHGVWSWDSWKHARALALFAPELAKDQMRVMLDYQNDAGMIPDVIYADGSENNWRDTKPPLAAWAVHGIWKATADTSFVEEVLPALLRYHAWWYRYRDHDGNGLCEYGSTDGTRIAAAWESGMDNAVRFDDAVMLQNGPSAWSLSQESVDLNAYLYAEKGYLAELAEVVGMNSEAATFREEAGSLKELIQETFYHEATGFFYDVAIDTKEPIVVEGPGGWIPLWAGLASAEQAEAVARIMTDPEKFSATVPLPTLTMDHPEFDPSNGYWRGPVWLDQAYFGIEGLRRYGFEEEALQLTRRLIESADGLSGDGPIFENYHPVTGEGLNAAHFSWSAAHLLMLYGEGFMDWGGSLERN